MTRLHKFFRIFFIQANGQAKSAQQLIFDSAAIPPTIFSMLVTLCLFFFCRMELPQNWERTKGTHHLVKLLPGPVELGLDLRGPICPPPKKKKF